MELTSLYSDKIIEIAGALPLTERLGASALTSRKTSRICGSVVEVDLELTDGIVVNYAHEISACALGQTSASIVAAHIIGSSESELRQLHADVEKMLKHDGKPPKGKWSDFKYLEPVAAYSARHASTMLVLEAVVACLDEANEAIST